MKKRKLKSFVLPTLYLLITITIFVGVIFMGRDIALTNKDYDYGTGILDNNDDVPVLEEETNVVSDITKPIMDGAADIKVHFYSKDESEEL